MATRLNLDDDLVRRAMELGRHRTKHDAVNQALALYVRRLEQEKIISLFGTIDYDPKYNQKKQRRRV